MTTWILRAAALAGRLLPPSVKRGLYRLGPLTAAIRGLLNRAAPAGLSQVSIAGGGLAGARMLLDLSLEKDLWLGTYEPELQAAVHRFARPGMTVYDVGANIGYVTLLLARAVGSGGRVFAFEPLPSNLERLGTNLELNGLSDQVIVLPLAVARRRAKARFWVHRSGGMGKMEGALGREERYQAEIEVEATDLDTFVYEEGHPAPDLVKMDIEGGEALALAGMERMLREARPVLLLELHGPEAAQDAWESLTAAGYRLHYMQRGYPPVMSVADLDWKAYTVGLAPGVGRPRS